MVNLGCAEDRQILTQSALVSLIARAWNTYSICSPSNKSENPKRRTISREPITSTGSPKFPTVSKSPRHLQKHAISLLKRINNYIVQLDGECIFIVSCPHPPARVVRGPSGKSCIQLSNFCRKMRFTSHALI
jgi:hypothetical protein